MSYQRVIPRDLFNEAKLLKCMGQLSLLIHDGLKWPLRVDFDGGQHGIRFLIEQNLASGGLEFANVYVMLGDREILMETGLNAKDNYPLYATTWEGDEVMVFNDDGTLHADFAAWLDKTTEAS